MRQRITLLNIAGYSGTRTLVRKLTAFGEELLRAHSLQCCFPKRIIAIHSGPLLCKSAYDCSCNDSDVVNRGGPVMHHASICSACIPVK